jgi:hypothetical protein
LTIHRKVLRELPIFFAELLAFLMTGKTKNNWSALVIASVEVSQLPVVGEVNHPYSKPFCHF